MTVPSELLPTTERVLLHRAAKAQADGRAPSLVAGVVRDGQLVWSGGRGRVDGAAPTVDTQYRIGSITKTFVGTLVMRLRDEGRLDLTDPLDKHLTGTAFGDRTIAQLLSHSSGITAESPGKWWERIEGGSWAELADTLGPETVKHRGSRKLHYSNVGFGALGELVARLRGASWDQVVHAEILEPLGMNRTTTMPEGAHAKGWAVHPWADVLLPEPAHDGGAMAPAGQLWSTATDLARWIAFIGGDTGSVLHPDTMLEMREPLMVDDGDTWNLGFGLSIQLQRDRGRRLAGHGGSMPGFLAMVLVDSATGTGALTLTNSTSGVDLMGLTTDLIDLTSNHEPLLPKEWAPLAKVDQALLELAGPWYWGPTPYGLRLLPDGWVELSPLSKRGRASRFRPEADGSWTGLDGYYSGETLRLVRHQDGSVSHLDLATFIFTRTPYDPAADVPGGVDEGGWIGG